MMVLETPRSERARVLSNGAGAGPVLRLLEVWAIAGWGFMAAPNRTVRRTSGTILVASLCEGGGAFFDFITSRSACARPKNASFTILPRLVRGLSASRVSPQPSQVSARE